MRAAELVSLVYFTYLVVVAAASGSRRARAMSVAMLVTVAAVELVFVQAAAPVLAMAREMWPLLLLLVGYRTAGVFYERPDTALEARLLQLDRWLSRRARASRALAEWLEAAYLGVYLIIPLGALVVAFETGATAIDRHALDRFWTTVLASGFACYGALPWIQTRPPRVVEALAASGAGGIRRLNLLILEHGSVGVNTLPSGHAATAVATALSVATFVPALGALFILAALFIALATIVGRYHYTVDTVLGALVGVAAWVVFVQVA